MQKNPEEVVRQVTDRLSYLGATSQRLEEEYMKETKREQKA